MCLSSTMSYGNRRQIDGFAVLQVVKHQEAWKIRTLPRFRWVHLQHQLDNSYEPFLPASCVGRTVSCIGKVTGDQMTNLPFVADCHVGGPKIFQPPVRP